MPIAKNALFRECISEILGTDNDYDGSYQDEDFPYLRLIDWAILTAPHGFLPCHKSRLGGDRMCAWRLINFISAMGPVSCTKECIIMK